MKNEKCHLSGCASALDFSEELTFHRANCSSVALELQRSSFLERHFSGGKARLLQQSLESTELKRFSLEQIDPAWV
jgi:hypothetical protein